jgi:hypothetical protein
MPVIINPELPRRQYSSSNTTTPVTILKSSGDTTDRATEINALLAAGGRVDLGVGVFWVGSSLLLNNKSYLAGAGRGATIIKALPTLTGNIIQTAGLGVSDVYDFGLSAFSLDGNYLSGDWSSSASVINRSLGNCIELQGAGWDVDIECYNTPETAFVARDLMAAVPKSQSTWCRLAIDSRVSGKEGVVLLGTNDYIVPEIFVGLAGMLPRPSSSTTFAVSTRYAGQPVDGVVLDGINVEVGTIHAYACWSGRGFATRNTCRLKVDHLISESNNGQVHLSAGTYGAGIGKLETRNLGVLHPNWTAAIPAYTAPDSRWDVLTVETLAPFSLGDVYIYRNVPMSIQRVVGTLGANLTGDHICGRFFLNNTQTEVSGGPESGGVFKTGDGLRITGKYNDIVVDSRSTRGACITLETTSRANTIRLNIRDNDGRALVLRGNDHKIDGVIYGNIGTANAALYRDAGGTNSYRNSRVDLTLKNCELNIETVGQPATEALNLTVEARSTDIVFTGTALDRNRQQMWRINALFGTAFKTTCGRTKSTTYDETIITEQTITVAHDWLFAPAVEQVSWSLSDSASISNAVVDYIRLNSVDATNLVFKVKLSAPATNGGAANTKLNIQIAP